MKVDDSFVAAMLSAVTSVKVNTYENCLLATNDIREKRAVNMQSLHSILLKKGPFGEKPTANIRTVNIFIQTLTGRDIPIKCSEEDSIVEVKQILCEREGIPVDQQKLIFAGQQLEDDRTVSSYKITDKCTLHLVLRLRGGDNSFIYMDPKMRSPEFDYNFTDVNDDGVTFKRGGHVYKRPVGTQRIALNVLNKYENNNWLGVNGRESAYSDVSGEWAVSYHGTGKHNARDIAEMGYLLSKGKYHAYGHGIYSTPDFSVALSYAENFIYKDEQFKVVIQNRVNPKTVKIVSKDEAKVGEYWISENEVDIRPYGFCIVKS